MNSEKVIQSYVYSEYGNFFVSTIYRKSSAFLALDSWFYETIAWELNEKLERGKIIAEEGGLSKHYEICKQLLAKGFYKEDNY